MDFRMEATLPKATPSIWQLIIDVPQIAACIPGCEQVEEKERLSHYSAVIKQKLGPFKLEVPAEIRVEEYLENEMIRARATGRDKVTRTAVDVSLTLVLLSVEGSGTKLVVSAGLQIAGRLASLGYGVIRKKAEENFTEFERRFLVQLEAA